ncbi:prolyl oligopeptidase family domain-containing protein [Purpureocillium lavendulum]|uniref:Dipeptidyl-peptidase V n=1 Tax=Purpureocillium lavendulum TaxID=1247861 RepID=A0AB34FI59_9HYPO|nr:prolyl oligopeptidase family domain-containing protein [Purpureocillium lavendulum]
MVETNVSDAMKARDIRATSTFQQVQQHYKNIIDPGIGKISNATDLSLSPDEKSIAFTAHVWESIEKSQATRIAEVDVGTGAVRFLFSGPGDAQKPRYSPDGRMVSYTAVNPETSLSELCLQDRSGDEKPAIFPLPNFSMEYAIWSSDGLSLLCGVAADGADTSDLFGAVKIASKEDGPAWLPKVETSQADHPGRTLFIFDAKKKEYRRATPPGLNIWEANWCGPHSVAGVVSEHGDEGAWYSSQVAVIDIKTGQSKIINTPPERFQASVPVGSPSGAHVAFTHAQCSDRGLAAGDLMTVDLETNSLTKHDTEKVDITNVVWIDNETMFVFGIRATQVVAGKVNILTRDFQEVWAASDGITNPNYQPDFGTPSADGSVFPILLEGWSRIPELTIITNGTEKAVLPLLHDGHVYVQSQLGESRLLRWKSSDGLEIEGFVRLPKEGKAPFPLVLNVHGGPVASFRNHWRSNSLDVLLTLHGYAVLAPNPRGSNGRGAEFTRHVFGDMGGKDVDDYMTGIDHLIELGLVDPKRLGVTGGSYGGYMSAWIITQTDRFAASVSVAPVVDWFSQHTLTNIPTFDQSFMQADPYEVAGPYRTRSPVLYAGKYPTPVLLISGEDDPATPPSQARQYHRALVEKGVKSMCLIYPGEGHGVRKYPAYVDYCSRVLGWFLEHVPVNKS